MSDMTVCGIVAEYNPFHNGHAYQISDARARGATHIVAVMSGNFVQRGGPACAPKHIRANAAIAGGADLIVELPLPYAMATAERFAFGAVSILNSLGCVDVLSFGSECGDINLLIKTAHAVRSPYCDDVIRTFLSEGLSYAVARQKAVEKLFGAEVAQVLEQPNNTLAVEYISQIIAQNSPIAPSTLLRKGAAHDSGEHSGGIASASHLRNLMELEGVAAIAPFVPLAASSVYQSAAGGKLMPFDPHALHTSVLSTLRRMDAEEFRGLPDLSEGIENRLYEAVRNAVSLDELFSLIKTKRYALSRIRRLVWSTYLGIPADLMHTKPPYIRILAMGRRGLEILSKTKDIASLPISHSLAKLEAHSDLCARFAKLEAKAADLYALGLPAVRPCGEDYRQKIAIR